MTAYPDQPILLIWDRAPWHFGEVVRQTLAAHPRLEVMYFPTASPDLNPQEHVWKDARHHVTHNHTFKTLKEVADAVEAHLTSHHFPCSLLHTPVSGPSEASRPFEGLGHRRGHTFGYDDIRDFSLAEPQYRQV